MATLGKDLSLHLQTRLAKEFFINYQASDLRLVWGSIGVGKPSPNNPIKLTRENNMTNSEEIQQAIDSSDGEGVLCLVWDNTDNTLQVKVRRVTMVNELCQVRAASGWSYDYGKLLGEDALQAFKDTGLIKMTEQEKLLAALERGESVSCWVSDYDKEPSESNNIETILRYRKESTYPFRSSDNYYSYATPVKPEEISFLK